MFLPLCALAFQTAAPDYSSQLPLSRVKKFFGQTW
jgi:hypothetical protein